MVLLRAFWQYRLWDIFSPRSLAVVPTVTFLGFILGKSVNSLKAKRGWLHFRIRTSCRPMARQRTRPAGYGVSRENNSRCLQLTAHIWVAQSAGSRNLVSSCVHAMAERTTEMARGRLGRPSGASSNIRTKFRTASSRFRRVSFRRRELPQLSLVDNHPARHRNSW